MKKIWTSSKMMYKINNIRQPITKVVGLRDPIISKKLFLTLLNNKLCSQLAESEQSAPLTSEVGT